MFCWPKAPPVLPNSDGAVDVAVLPKRLGAVLVWAPNRLGLTALLPKRPVPVDVVVPKFMHKWKQVEVQ